MSYRCQGCKERFRSKAEQFAHGMFCHVVPEPKPVVIEVTKCKACGSTGMDCKLSGPCIYDIVNRQQ